MESSISDRLYNCFSSYLAVIIFAGIPLNGKALIRLMKLTKVS